jgi:hypothetical protein
MKIDIGCGDNKKEGFTGIDKFKTDSTDMVVDLFAFPWPLEFESVEEVHCSHFFEHVPKEIRAKFMEELHRVMKVGAKATFITPCGDRALQDATHEWPPIVPGSYLYFNADWRKQNKLQHGFYDIKADFDYSYGYGLAPDIAVRNADFQAFAVAHYNNAVTDLHVTLTKKGIP